MRYRKLTRKFVANSCREYLPSFLLVPFIPPSRFVPFIHEGDPIRLQEEQYAKWMAACRLAAKGRSLSDNTYESEVKSIISFLEMQRPALAPAISPSSLDLSPEDYMAPRSLKKFKSKVSAGALIEDNHV